MKKKSRLCICIWTHHFRVEIVNGELGTVNSNVITLLNRPRYNRLKHDRNLCAKI